MINVTRNPTSPAYLTTDEIRAYIVAAIRYRDDPEHNTKPDKPTAYRHSDLLVAFDRDFYSKCYLTERKYANSWVMDVEHFIPQAEDASLVYEWTNLFPADATANQMKLRRTPTGGYLKPCNPADDVEEEIVCTMGALGDNPQFSAKTVTNIKAVNTSNLLNKVHNGDDKYTKDLTADLRHTIQKKYVDILNKIIDWQACPDGQMKAQAERDLRDMLSRKSSFTKICRSIPAVVQYVPADFLD